MWTSLNRDDLRSAQDEVRKQRIDTEARHAEEIRAINSRHAEELKGLDAKVTQLVEIERAIDEFFREYLQTNPDGEQERTSDTNGDQQKTAEISSHLEEPLELKVIATNWGNVPFTSALHTDYSEP